MATIAMSSNSADSNSWKNMLKRPKKGVPEGLWIRCPGCQQTIFRKEAEKHQNVCPECGDHWYVSARQRIAQVLDAGTFEERFADLLPADPLEFVDPGSPYPQRIIREQKRTGLSEAAVVGTGMIRARRVAFGVTDSGFMMGSMGSVVGEKLSRIIELATEQQLPLIIISGSGGGARMHEGILSLMQMAKTSSALARFDAVGGLFISVLTNPTMGGVAASFASLGDVIFAEPKAMVGFAGPRVIKAAIRMELPKGFQTSEFLLEHGFIDRIVRRKDLKSELARTIDYCGK
jgi:acetyl-CoA carboxylase carboxyl transferase subunit beta